MGRKNICVAYFLWLTGGWLGLHHFYLGRDKHALVWYCLPGGYFGFGWFRDLWRIPEYVRDANDDPAHLESLAEKMRDKKKPPFSFARFTGQLLMGNMLAVVVSLGIPNAEEMPWGVDLSWVGVALRPAATAAGIWLVGNIGRQKGSSLPPLLACYATVPLVHLGYAGSGMMTVAGILAFQWKSRAWRRQVTERRHLCKRVLILTLCGGLYSSLWASYMYFNMRIVTKNGDEIPFRHAVFNFVKSPAVQEFRRNLGELWDHGRQHGFWSTLQNLIDSLDPLGEKNALKVLDLKSGSTQEVIRSRYRELSKKWHPDKFKGEEEKAEAHERFVEIQQAYEKLSSIKHRRMSKNKRSDDGEKEESCGAEGGCAGAADQPISV